MNEWGIKKLDRINDCIKIATMKDLKIKSIGSICCFLLFGSLLAQEVNKSNYANYNSAFLLRFDEGKAIQKSNEFHTGIRPYRSNELMQYIDPDSVIAHYADINDLKYWKRRLLLDPLYIYQPRNHDVQIVVNPLFDFSFGSDDLSDNGTFTNTRGVQVLGQLGDNVWFYSDLTETQTRVPQYIHNWADSLDRVLPGMGQATSIDHEGEYDYGFSTAWVQYKTKKFFTFELGTGKHFIGEGYRSMLLSDVAFNYPYFKIRTDFGRVQYVNIYSEHRDLHEEETDALHRRKYNVTHYLSMNLGKKWNVGFFETVTWDGQTDDRGVELGFLNPVIFLRTVERVMGSYSGNEMLGLNLSYKMTDQWKFYGQFILDEFKGKELFSSSGWWGNKYGLQLGTKAYDAFGVDQLNLLAEFNMARPFMYSHFNGPESDGDIGEGGLTNYAHNNQALAHPLGANFIEFLTRAKYTHKRLAFMAEFMWAKKGFDIIGEGSYGGDIYRDYEDRVSNFNNDLLQGNETTITYIEGKASYLINPQTNFIAELGIAMRNQTPTILNAGIEERKDVLLSFGLKTDLFPRYYDF